MEMVIHKAPEANCHLTLASLAWSIFFASDVWGLEMHGFNESRSGEHHKAPGEASRGSYEAPWRCFGSSRRFIKAPKPRSSIHESFTETPRSFMETPSHDLSTLLAFESLQEGPRAIRARGWAGLGWVGLVRAGIKDLQILRSLDLSFISLDASTPRVGGHN